MTYSLFSLLVISIHFITSTVGNEALVGGQLAAVNQFKYQVSLVNPGRGHICGGGIIDDKFILTAAHCVIKENGHIDSTSIIVIAGTNDLRKLEKPTVIGYVEKIFVPTEFHGNAANTNGDIAVLRLHKSLHVWAHRNLKKLSLPRKSDKINTGKTAVIAGFGQYIANLDALKIKMSDQLRYSEADIIDTNQCQAGYVVQDISAKHICARVKQYNGKVIRGFCLGDSGSPLVLNEKTVVGIYSRGDTSCTEKIRAGIYTRVTSYLDFIRYAMKDKYSKDIRTLNLFM